MPQLHIAPPQHQDRRPQQEQGEKEERRAVGIKPQGKKGGGQAEHPGLLANITQCQDPQQQESGEQVALQGPSARGEMPGVQGQQRQSKQPEGAPQRPPGQQPEGQEGAVADKAAVCRGVTDPLVVDARKVGPSQQEVVQDGVQVVDAGSLPGFGVFGFFRQHPQECLLQSLHKGRTAKDLFRYLRSEGFSRDPREGSRFSVFGDTGLRVNDSFLFRLFLLLCAEDPVPLFKIADVRDPRAAKGAFFDDKAGAALSFS